MVLIKTNVFRQGKDIILEHKAIFTKFFLFGEVESLSEVFFGYLQDLVLIGKESCLREGSTIGSLEVHIADPVDRVGAS